tara:strand:- start:1294 stop:1515 length:222 start_codon:yes stop_codon:yes gene_type:complete
MKPKTIREEVHGSFEGLQRSVDPQIEKLNRSTIVEEYGDEVGAYGSKETLKAQRSKNQSLLKNQNSLVSIQKK